MRIVRALWDLIRQDRRPQREIERELAFIQAANSLQTLRVTPEGAMFIDPEEFREQIVSAREQLKHIVHDPRALGGPFRASQSHRAERARVSPSRLLWSQWTALRSWPGVGFPVALHCATCASSLQVRGDSLSLQPVCSQRP